MSKNILTFDIDLTDQDLTVYTVPTGKVAMVIPTYQQIANFSSGSFNIGNQTLRANIITAIYNSTSNTNTAPPEGIWQTADNDFADSVGAVKPCPHKVHLIPGDTIKINQYNSERLSFKCIVIEEDIGAQ